MRSGLWENLEVTGLTGGHSGTRNADYFPIGKTPSKHRWGIGIQIIGKTNVLFNKTNMPWVIVKALAHLECINH